MDKKLLEMLNAIGEKKNEAKGYLNENKMEEARAAKKELEELQEKFNLAKELYDSEKETIVNKVVEPKAEVSEKKNFINAVRSRFKNGMAEGVAADGGYTVPQDIQTKINELRQTKDALQNLVTVEPVATLSGSRVFKTRSQQTGFTEVSEGGTIAEKETPKFSNLTYTIKKYAGFFKVTNELLKDSDQAIETTLINWIGNDSRVTRNKLILTELDKKAKTAIATTDDIKDTLNVTLDPAFRYTAQIVTNQDGFNWLDKQKDKDGNYLLQPSVTAPTGKQLFGVDIAMISNKDLATAENKAPFIIGDLKEAVVLFDREQLSIATSDTAGDAFTTDVTLFRAIEREEVKTKDAEAFVYGQIDLT